jgi:hypothetical protein
MTVYDSVVEDYLANIRRNLATTEFGTFTAAEQQAWAQECARRIEGMYGRADVLALPEAPGVEGLCMSLLPNDARSEKYRQDPDHRWDYRGARVYEHALAMFHYGLPLEVWKAWRTSMGAGDLVVHHACDRPACWNWHHLHWLDKPTNSRLASHKTAATKRARRVHT